MTAGDTWPEWPDPSGPKPDNWPANQWRAFVALSHGMTNKDAGRLVDPPVQPSTVSGWASKWRIRYGPEFARFDRTGRTPKDNDRGLVAAHAATSRRWAEVRHLAAARLGELGDASVELARLIVQDHLDDPARRAALDLGDALTLARIADIMARRAETLDPAEEDPGPNPAGGSGILDDLELPTGAEIDDVLTQVEIIVATHRTRKGPPDATGGRDIVDVTEAGS